MVLKSIGQYYQLDTTGNDDPWPGSARLAEAWVTRLRWEQSGGVFFERDEMNAEALKLRWDAVQSFDHSSHPDSINVSLRTLGRHMGLDIGL